MSPPAAAVALSDRRAPKIAAVEWAYAVFQIKRDLGELRPWQRWLFSYAWLPLMRFCVTRLGLPLVEKIDSVTCPHCAEMVTIPGGGCWTEKEGIVTTREAAVEACKTTDWYFHRLKVNGAMSGETARKRVDHDFPKADTRQYQRASSDVDDVSLSQLEHAVNRQRELAATAIRLNSVATR